MSRIACFVGSALLIALSLVSPAQARFVSVDPVQPNQENGENFNRYHYANNNPYTYTDPDGRLPVLIPIVAGVTWMLTSGDANAPAPGTPTRAMSPAEAASRFVEAVPAGRTGIALRAAPDGGRDSQTGSYTNTHASGKTYDGKGGRQRSNNSGKRVEQETGDPHVATDWTPAHDARDAFKQESVRLDSHGGPKSERNYNQIESPGRQYRTEDDTR